MSVKKKHASIYAWLSKHILEYLKKIIAFNVLYILLNVLYVGSRFLFSAKTHSIDQNNSNDFLYCSKIIFLNKCC